VDGDGDDQVNKEKDGRKITTTAARARKVHKAFGVHKVEEERWPGFDRRVLSINRGLVSRSDQRRKTESIYLEN
jgi:hypothetical protein